jgi:hypothetical protein
MNRKEKNCLNPECDEIIGYYENPKKLFCNPSCKNRFHYLSDKEKNYEVYEFEKGLKTNYNIIKKFINEGVYIIDLNAAKALGFNKDIYMDIIEYNPEANISISLKRIKDVFFSYDIRKNTIILYYEK